MMKYHLNFVGYKPDSFNSCFSNEPGIYLVYRGILDYPRGNVYLKELVYIGETDDFYERHLEHVYEGDFTDCLQNGEELFYSTAELMGGKNDRLRAQDTLIYKLKPRYNDMSTVTFNHPSTMVVSSGEHVYVPNVVVAS